MAKVIKLTESDLTRIVRRVMNEMEDTTSGVEEILDNNPKVSRAFDKLVDILQNNPEIKDELESMVDNSLNEAHEYYDYRDSQPQKISRKSYWMEKLMSIGIPAAVAATIGWAISHTGGGTDMLEMALSAAGMGAGIGATLVSTTARKKVDEPEGNEEEM